MHNAIRVESLCKTYQKSRDNEVKAVDGISFSVNQGEIVGILGGNGAGKSTTLKCISTLIQPSSGSVCIFGHDAARHRRKALRHITAVLEGDRNLYWRQSVYENLLFFGGLHGMSFAEVRPYATQLLDVFKLTQKADTPVQELSRGMKQKTALACALVKRTDIVLLDEPTLGLDVETTYELRTIIERLAHEENRTILLSSHDMDVVDALCPRVVVIQNGRLITDDRVDRLRAGFSARSFHIHGKGRLSPVQEQGLRAACSIHSITAHDNTLKISCTTKESVDIYNALDRLRLAGVLLESIERDEPNLEEIFLRLIRESQQ